MFWHRNVPLRLQRLLLTWILPSIISLLVILIKMITQIMFETKLCLHMFCNENLSFGFKWVLLACFEPKMNFLLTWFLPLTLFESKGYSQLSCVPKRLSQISLKENVVFTTIALFWFRRFLSTSIYYHTFSGPFLELNWTLTLYLDQNIVLKCFDTNTSNYDSKGYCSLGFYH